MRKASTEFLTSWKQLHRRSSVRPMEKRPARTAFCKDEKKFRVVRKSTKIVKREKVEALRGMVNAHKFLQITRPVSARFRSSRRAKRSTRSSRGGRLRHSAPGAYRRTP